MKGVAKAYLLAAAVAFITLLVYLPVLQNKFVEWDDGDYASANLHIRSLDLAFFKWAFTHFFASNWHPLTWISHAIDYALWGLNPLGHHLTSIILHGLNTFLVVMLVVMLFAAFRKGARDKAPLARDQLVLIAAGTTGLLFGLHPLHVESVAWVAERKDLLCAFFSLLCIMMYTKCADGYGARNGERDAARIRDNETDRMTPFLNKYYLASLGLFVLALLSKPMAITIPAVLLLLDWYPFNRIRSWKTVLAVSVEKLPFLVLSLASAVVTVFAQKAGGALSSVALIPLPTRALVAAKAIIAYLGKLIWPLDLVPFYPYPESASLASLEYFVPVALVMGISLLFIINSKKWKLWSVAWGYYCVTLLPVLGLVQVGGQSMADRYTYLPSLGPFLVAGAGAAWFWDKTHAVKNYRLFIRLLGGAAAAALIGFLSFATIQQSGVWKDSLTLWTYVITKDPTVSLAYNNRGLTYDDLGRFNDALADFNKAIELAPSDHQAYSNRGMLYGKAGRYDKAIEDFRKAVVLKPSSPEAYNNLGIAYAKTGLVDEAIEQFNKAITIDPGQAMSYYNRGLLYSRSDRRDRAVSDYRKACDLGNNDACSALNQ